MRRVFRAILKFPIRVAKYGYNILKVPAGVKGTYDTVRKSSLFAPGNSKQVVAATVATANAMSMIAARNVLSKKVLHVVLLAHHIEAWTSIDGLYRALERADDFRVTVVSMPRRFPGATHFGDEQLVHEGLKAFNVPHLRLKEDTGIEATVAIRALNPDVIFRQSQWDPDVGPGVSTLALSFARLCLVPYETMNIVENVHRDDSELNSAVDTLYHRAAWMVFCANEKVLEAAQQTAALAGRQFRVVGHPKAHFIKTAQPQWPIERAGKPAAGRILWSAHHSIGDRWTRFGTFPAARAPMLQFAKDNPDIDVVFMPHPMLPTFGNHHDSPISAREYERFVAAWEQLPNTAVYQGPNYASLLQASDVMVTDGLSMLVEYQILKKPLVFIERKDHRPFNPVGEILRSGMHSVPDVPAAMKLAVEFLDGKVDELASNQAQNADMLFPYENPGERILEEIRKQLQLERSELL